MTDINNKHLKHILKEQCKRVGADFNKLDFSKEDWFEKYTWTEEEENNFKQWMMNYLKENKDARQDLMRVPSTNPIIIRGFTTSFILFCGWKYDKSNKKE